MAIPHAASGEVIDIRPLGDQLAGAATRTLVKTDELEVIRLVVPAGKLIPPHKVAGPITVQCLEGGVEFSAHGQWLPLGPGYMLHLAGGELHALKGVVDSSVLLTIQLPHRHSEPAL
ncbi:MAG: cupin domain-containing protein [Planctomycetia bacterium]